MSPVCCDVFRYCIVRVGIHSMIYLETGTDDICHNEYKYFRQLAVRLPVEHSKRMGASPMVITILVHVMSALPDTSLT